MTPRGVQAAPGIPQGGPGRGGGGGGEEGDYVILITVGSLPGLAL